MFLESSRHNWHCSPPHPRQVLSMHFETHVEMVLVSWRQSWHCSPPQPRHWLSMQSLTVSAALPTSNANRKRRDMSFWDVQVEELSCQKGEVRTTWANATVATCSASKHIQTIPNQPNFHECSTWQAENSKLHGYQVAHIGASSSPMRPMAWGPDSGSMPSSSQTWQVDRTWTSHGTWRSRAPTNVEEKTRYDVYV